MNLVVDGKIVRSAAGPNTDPGGSEMLEPASWDVAEFVGREATLVIVDQRKNGWGHICVDQIVQSDTDSAPLAAKVVLEKTLKVDGSHLIVPVSNTAKGPNVVLLGIYDGATLVQDFNVGLPQGNDASWLAAYPLEHFGLKGKQIKIATADGGKVPEALRAAFDREPTTCRDLCVKKHVNVSLTDPAGYTFAVATDSDCRNRLLHSRPIDASEYLPALWQHGVRSFQLLFNVAGDPVQDIVRGYRQAVDALERGESPDLGATRRLLDGAFTRGHFARAV